MTGMYTCWNLKGCSSATTLSATSVSRRYWRLCAPGAGRIGPGAVVGGRGGPLSPPRALWRPSRSCAAAKDRERRRPPGAAAVPLAHGRCPPLPPPSRTRSSTRRSSSTATKSAAMLPGLSASASGCRLSSPGGGQLGRDGDAVRRSVPTVKHTCQRTGRRMRGWVGGGARPALAECGRGFGYRAPVFIRWLLQAVTAAPSPRPPFHGSASSIMRSGGTAPAPSLCLGTVPPTAG